MSKQNGGIIGPDNVTTGGFNGVASGVFKLGEATKLIRESKWPVPSPFTNTVPNSVRLDGGGTYFSRTQTAGNRRTWTQSGWYKFDGNDPGNAQSLVSTNGTNTGTNFHYTLEKGGSSGGALDTLSCHGYSGDIFQTIRLLRDYSGWYHIVLTVDTTQGTSANRMKLYINGESVALSAQAQYPAQNFEFGVNNNNIVIGLGTHPGSVSGYQFSGYMANLELVDGLAYGPEYFGSTNADSGIWTAIPTSTISNYGTNGFKLAFANSGALGTDTSGKGNNFTANSITSIDQSSDSPSNNFATLNPLASLPNTGTSTFTEGNLTSSGATGSYVNGGSTLMMPSGKWYCEMKYISTSNSNRLIVGITQDVAEISRINQDSGALNTFYVSGDGNKNIQGTDSSYGSSFDVGDIVGIALDLDNNKLYFSKNGTFQNSGDPTSGSTGTGAITGFVVPSATLNGGYFFFSGSNSNAQYNNVSFNFGNPSFAISSSNADSSGFGNFEYAVPTGYLSLCTNNLNL